MILTQKFINNKNNQTKPFINNFSQKAVIFSINRIISFKYIRMPKVNNKKKIKIQRCIDNLFYVYNKKKIFIVTKENFKIKGKQRKIYNNAICSEVNYEIQENKIFKNLEKSKIEIFEIKANIKNNEIFDEKDLINKSLIHIKPRGLKNINGTCYMNTVLQCLFHVK